MTDASRRDHDRQRIRAVREAKASVRRTRAKLLAQTRKLAAQRSRNRHQGAAKRRQRTDDGTNGPYSTVPSTDTNAEAAAGHHSTVPERPAKSTVTPEPRLYGLGLYRRATSAAKTDSNPKAKADSAPDADRQH